MSPFCARRSLLVLFVLGFALSSVAPVQAADEGQLGHMVFFTLKDRSPEAQQKLEAACRKYLAKHEGIVYFSVGSLAKDLDREVNDRDFDVALHMVFADKEAHDKYQTHARHLKFIEEHKDSWAKVRVFDSYITEGEDE